MVKDSNGFYIRRRKNGFHRIHTKDILFIKSDSIYINISSEGCKKLIARQTLGRIEKKLPSNFLKVHRNCIVNMDKIKYLDFDNLHLNGSSEVIKVSRTHLKRIRSFWPTITEP